MHQLPVKYSKLTSKQRQDVRRQYINEQKGLCHYCGVSLFGPHGEKAQGVKINWNLFPPGFRNWPVHLHHDHKTGMTIGAVHARCNAVLWVKHGE
jgi:hypothetical protein